MASTITNFSSSIDAQFPVPGQDNDTQGFRNNFGNIKNALDIAASEISDLQVINSALTSLASEAPSSPVGKEGDIIGQIYATTGTVYICTQSYDIFNPTENIWAKINAVWPW
jgi:hypothetical protein